MTNWESIVRPLSALVIAILTAASASAQNSFPMITHTTPVAVQRGTVAEISVEGQMNFRGAYRMLVDGGGISAEVIPTTEPKSGTPPVRSVKLKLTVAADAALGVREFRLATALGVSSLGQLLVVDEPVVQESGVNNTPAQANLIPVPCV